MSYSQTDIDLITLASFDEMPYKAKRDALGGLKTFCPDFEACREDMIKNSSRGVYNKVRDKFYDRAYREELLLGLSRRGVGCITLASEAYPKRLKEIPNPPIALFYKGDVSLLKHRCFAVVGSRRTPANMLAECKKTAGELKSRFTVVSGCATGADCAALQGAEYGGVSVIAFGFDYLKGCAEYDVVQKTEQNGLLLSEYKPSTAPRNYYFPVRNRIIAGLSEGVLVVSAAKKSGALITAGYAQKFGREVFAFPYSIGVAPGEGCNALIQKGARLAVNSLDIFSVFGIIDIKKPQTAPLNGDEKRVLEIIKESGEVFVADVAAQMGVPPFKLIPVLSSLEIKNLIVRLGGNRYAAL